MTDISLAWDNLVGHGDWQIAHGDLVATTDGLEDLKNAIGLSLFTDARCDPSFVTWDGNPRGYWGDSYTTTPLGSNLWQLDRAKKNGTSQLLLQARDFATVALQWLIDDGLVDTISVNTQWINANSIGILVQVTQPRQSATQAWNYAYSWN